MKENFIIFSSKVIITR